MVTSFLPLSRASPFLAVTLSQKFLLSFAALPSLLSASVAVPLSGTRRIAAVKGLIAIIEREVGEQIRVGRLGFAGHGHLGGHSDGGGAV